MNIYEYPANNVPRKSYVKKPQYWIASDKKIIKNQHQINNHIICHIHWELQHVF